MKKISLLLFLVLMFGCNENGTDSSTTTDAEEWSLRYKTISTHSYNNKGHLEKTFTTLYNYLQGQLIDSSISVTTRKYDVHDNLIYEKVDELLEDNKTNTTSEDIRKYDIKNYLAERISFFNNKLASHSKYFYDSAYNNIKTILIQATTNPFDLNNSQQQITYDTTLQFSEFDSQSNKIMVRNTTINGEIKSIFYKNYIGNQLISSYSINSFGDTTSHLNVMKEGKLSKQINTYDDGSSDTTWEEGNKIVKTVDSSINPPFKSKMKYKYNSKGEEIESIHYFKDLVE